MDEPDYNKEMKLPSGKTCNDCQSAKRCFAFGYSKPGRTSCDFWPSRFFERINEWKLTPTENTD